MRTQLSLASDWYLEHGHYLFESTVVLARRFHALPAQAIHDNVTSRGQIQIIPSMRASLTH